MDSRATPADLERLLCHTDWLTSLARRLVVDSAAAEDLVQETWLAAMKNPPDPGRPVRPWLAGVVRKLARMRSRTEGRLRRRQTIAAKRDELPSTATLVEGVDTQRRLAEVVLTLDEPYRTALLLRYYHDLSSAEIARRQGIPSGTVRWRLKRGLDELRSRLDRSWNGRRNWCVALVGLVETGEALSVGSAGSGAGTGLALKYAAALVALIGVAVVVPGLVASKRVDGTTSVDAALTLVRGTDPAPEGELDRTGTETAGRASSLRTVAEDPAATEERDALALEIRVSGGSPAAGRRVVLVDPDGAAQTATTDDAGRVRFGAGSGSGAIYVERRGAFVQRVPLELAAATREITLATGPELAGRVFVDGDPPDEPLALEIGYDKQVFGDLELPEPVRLEFGFCRRARATTDELGAFRFHSLPADWTGELLLPPGYVERSRASQGTAAGRLHVAGPTQVLELDLARMPRVRGRLLTSAGVPVPMSSPVACSGSTESGQRFERRGQTDGEGRFAVGLWRDGLASLVVESLGSGLEHSFVVPSFEAGDRGWIDVGDLVLDSSSAVRLAVRSSGEPVEGAVARAVGRGPTSAPAGPDGIVAISPIAGPVDGPLAGPVAGSAGSPARVFVGAAGFRTVDVELDESSAGTTEVELERTNRLALRILDDEGAPLARALVRLRADQAPFVTGTGFRPERLRAGFAGRFRSAGVDHADFVTDTAGLLALEDLRPGLPLLVEVLDPTGARLLVSDLSPLERDERRELTLVVEGRLRTLRGVCSSEDGEVLVGVYVELSGLDEGGTSRRLRSGLHGEFEFGALARESVRLTVWKAGFGREVIDELELSKGLTEVELTLEPSRDLRVRVLDALGAPVGGGTLAATDTGGRRYAGTELEPGVFRIDHLSDPALSLELELSGESYLVEPTATDTDVEIRVPAHGRLVVRLARLSSSDARWRVAVRSGERPVAVATLSSLAARGGEALEAVFSALLPGEYELQLEQKTGEDQPFAAVDEPQRVRVRAGTTTRVEL